jgi:hypothetical protein
MTPPPGRWLSEDPIGFRGGDSKLQRYVGNNSVNYVDPSGLAGNGWEWHWHHLLDQSIFTPEFMARHGLNIDIHSPEYGWMMRGMDHTGAGGIHPEGWSRAWRDWIGDHEGRGTKITKAMIDEKLAQMMNDYNLCNRGFPAKFPYHDAQNAYKIAERMARQKAADALGDAASRLGRGRGRVGGGKGRGPSGFIVGTVMGFGVALFGGKLLGSDDPRGDALESLDPFSPSMMGNGEITQEMRDQWTYEAYRRHQAELSAEAARRERLRGGIDALAREGSRSNRTCPPTSCGNPSRASLFPR